MGYSKNKNYVQLEDLVILSECTIIKFGLEKNSRLQLKK